MAIPALVVSSLLLTAAPPAAAAKPAIAQDKIFELAISISAGVIYRMDSMPASLNKAGAEYLQHARSLASQLGLPLPDHAVLTGPQSDTLEAMGYVMGASSHPTARALQERQGRAAAALFEFGLLSHLAMTSVVPGSDNGKSLAETMEAAASESGVPRDKWGPFVDALRAGKTKDAAKDALAVMIPAVGKSLPKATAAR